MRGGRAAFYILSVLALAAVVWLVFTFAPSSQIDTPPVVLPTPTPPGDDNDDRDDGVGGGAQEISVTKDNVRTVLASLSRVDSYHRLLTSETFWEGGSSIAQTEVWVRGDSVKIVTTENGRVRNVLITGGELTAWYEDGGSAYTGPAGERDADEYQRLSTYEDLLAADPALITDAGYVDRSGTRCIYAEYTDESLGYRHRIYVSVESGLVMGDETYDGEVLIFNLVSSEPEIITPEDEVFAVPGS